MKKSRFNNLDNQTINRKNKKEQDDRPHDPLLEEYKKLSRQTPTQEVQERMRRIRKAFLKSIKP